MNWLQRARREISELAGGPTAVTAEGHPGAVVGMRRLAESGSIGSNGSAPPWQLLELDLREDFEERASIMEFDGGLTREEAERAAWALVSTRYRLH